MPLNIRELIVVIAIAMVVFRLAKPFALLFTSSADYSRRIKAWYVLTIAAFTLPSFWLFALIAVPVMVTVGRKDPNPSAVYILLLQVVPQIDIPVPMIGMPYLFMINNSFLVSCCVLVPVAIQLHRSRNAHRDQGLQFMDWCLLAYGILSAVFYVHILRPDGDLYPNTLTESMRRGMVFFFDFYIPYFVISRVSTDRRILTDVMATCCVSGVVLAGLGTFESVRHWLLFGEIAGRWGAPGAGSPYLLRGESLRAMASTGHAMALASMLVAAYGLLLYFQHRADSKRWAIAGIVLLWAGLVAAYTRGAWIGAILVYFMFAALQPGRFSKVLKAGVVAVIVGGLVYLSPLGDKITSVLPWFGGKVDVYNVTYRERLWDRSWQIVSASPMLGDQAAILKMQDLRQGQGIVDIVNTYDAILLNNGFVGLSLFLLFFLAAILKAWNGSRQVGRQDPDLALLGTTLVTCIVALLVIFENGGFGGGVARIFYALAALATGYAFAVKARQRQATAPILGAATNAALRLHER